jgi:hypothetical protein
MSDERREVRAKVRAYEKDGETKNVYATVGTAWVSEHGSKISIQLETVPVTPEWDGRLFINKPYENKDSTPIKQHEVIEKTRDNLPDYDFDKPISLQDIPF